MTAAGLAADDQHAGKSGHTGGETGNPAPD
jgi:hypothetical protein